MFAQITSRGRSSLHKDGAGPLSHSSLEMDQQPKFEFRSMGLFRRKQSLNLLTLWFAIQQISRTAADANTSLPRHLHSWDYKSQPLGKEHPVQAQVGSLRPVAKAWGVFSNGTYLVREYNQ